MVKRLIAVVLLSVLAASAQLPAAPEPQRTPLFARTSTFVAAEALAWGSTIADAELSQRAFRHGCVEGNTFLFGVNARPSAGALIARAAIIEGPLTALSYFVFRKLRHTDAVPAWVIFPAIQSTAHLMAGTTNCQ